MYDGYIPPNHPTQPRWLLDLHEWKILPYEQIPRSILDDEGYGIVSYTWGNIADWDNLATGLPKGVFWDLPTTKKWPLSKAKDVMNTIGTRFIWWDWMCVPQGGKGRTRSLTDKLKEVQGQEIGKQWHIYRDSKKSIVWLHSTFWSKDSAIKSLLMLPSPHEVPLDSQSVVQYVEDALDHLDAAQKGERWLTSGWTLQEGVLLGKTRLIDYDGTTLSNERFRRNPSDDSYAEVDHLGAAVEKLAYHIGGTYFVLSQGYPPNSDHPEYKAFADLLPNDAEMRTWLSMLKKILVRSGLVGFSPSSPLEILAGKGSRYYSRPQDAYWALIGALELEDVKVTYDPKVPILDIKRTFFEATLKKYQWIILFLPYLETQVEEKQDNNIVKRNFQWTDIADGVLLPVSLFPIEFRYEEKAYLASLDLPTLSFIDDSIVFSTREDCKLELQRVSADGVTHFRHYRQDEKGLKFVSSNEVVFADDVLLSDAWFIPLQRVEDKDGSPGRRCVVVLGIEATSSSSSISQTARGTFGGVADIWNLGPAEKGLDELVLLPSKPMTI